MGGKKTRSAPGLINGRDRVSQILRDAQGYSQTVVKISSHSSGKSKSQAHATYISRNHNLDLEDEKGATISDADELNARMNEWQNSTETRTYKDGRQTRFSSHFVFSSPEGSDPETVKDAVREFAGEYFKNHEYLMALHTDTNNPHVHLMVKAQGLDLKRLRIGRAQLKEIREGYGEKLRDRGIKVTTSYRSDRGVGQKGDKQSVHHMRKDKTNEPYADAVLKERLKAGFDSKLSPWKNAMNARHLKTIQEFRKIADSMGAINGKLSKMIHNHIDRLEKPKTRYEQVKESVKQKQGRDKDQDNDFER